MGRSPGQCCPPQSALVALGCRCSCCRCCGGDRRVPVEDGTIGHGGSGFRNKRPGDSFETRPAVFRDAGGVPLADPVWVDLLTGRVYDFPRENVIVSAGVVRYLDIPVYDSPCVLTERDVLDAMT